LTKNKELGFTLFLLYSHKGSTVALVCCLLYYSSDDQYCELYISNIV